MGTGGAALLLLAAGCSKDADPAPTEVLPQSQLPQSGRVLRRLTESPVYQYTRAEALSKGDPRARLDLSTRRSSRDGLYRVTVLERPEPVRQDALQAWIVRIETAAGAPVSDAQISVHATMPQHGHPMPTRPRITASLGGGRYRLEGLQFSMPGWWEVTLHVAHQKREDSVTFNLDLQ